MRCYLPSTLERLARAATEGVIAGAGAVVAASDGEEDEYAAMRAAADLSSELLAGPGRRVVLVAEISGEAVPERVDVADLVAIHADTDPVDPADTDPPDLAWFAVQELGDLIG